MARKINKKTGQVVKVTDERTAKIAENLGATEDFNPQPQTFQIGDKKLTKQEYDIAKNQLGFSSGKGGIPNANVQAAINQQNNLNPKINKEQALAQVPIPRAEDIATETANPLKDASQIGRSQIGLERSGINVIAQSNLGQSINAKAFLDELKNNPENQAKYNQLRESMIESGLTPEQVTDDPLLQGALRLNLNKNDLEVLNNGKADVKLLAIAVEGLPITSQITKWTGGALTPTSAFNKIKDLDKQVTELTSKMDNWNEAITRNPQLVNQYEDLIEETEQQILDLQSRIKLMTIQSPILQNSPEEVENMGVSIDRALTKTTKLKSVVINTRYGGA